MDNKELRSPRYKMTVDDFFHKPHPFKMLRVVVCDEKWQYDIVTKVFTRMGKKKRSGFKYRYNDGTDGTDNALDDDWRAWILCSRDEESCCLDNFGGWGNKRAYKYPPKYLYEEYSNRSHPDYSVYEMIVNDGRWNPTDFYGFYDIDFSMYLTPDEMDTIRSKGGIDVMSNAKEDRWFRRIKPFECIGTEEENDEKMRLLGKIRNGGKKITIKSFFDLGIHGDIQIQCDEPWQVELLSTVFERMGQDTFYLQYADKFPCYIGPGNYSYKTTVHFDDVDLTEYLTLDEVKKLVYKQVDEPIARINACRNPQNSISFYDFLRNDRMAVDFNRGDSKEAKTAFSNLLWDAQPYERQKRGREKIIGQPYGYLTNKYYNYARKEDCERWGYKIIKLEDLVLPLDKLAPRELKALANNIERRRVGHYCSPFGIETENETTLGK